MSSTLSRRQLLKDGAILSSGIFLLHSQSGFSGKKKPLILLRSGWQIENIGDVAHTPGFLSLLEKHLPGARAIFWPHYHVLPQSEVDMLKQRFPSLKIVQGKLVDGKPGTPELQQAFADADIFINNSGPATLGWAEASAFKKLTGKPFGVFGVTYGLYGKPEKAVLSDADFLYFRDSVSLALAKSDGISAPVMAFGPDAAFATDVADYKKADAYLQSAGLEPQKFVVCIPKHRYTPMWLHKEKGRPFDAERNTRNEAMAEHDHAPMREAITAIVRQTGMKVLIGHEDETQLPIGKTWVWDKLPDDVKPAVVWRNTPWLLEEALAIYKQSAGIFGHEQHSPIMCIGHGIPAILGRWEEQSSKGFMWKDIGLDKWLFDFDKEEDIKRYVPTVLDMVQNREASKQYAEAARKLVFGKYKEGFGVIKDSLQRGEKRKT